MRGLIVERATPGNVLDIYELFVKMNKDGGMRYPIPSKNQIKEYYFTLLQELANPTEIFLLARRGRTYWGYLSANIAFRPFGERRILWIKYVYVAEKKRKLGIAKKLYQELTDTCHKMDISVGEFLCEDSMCEYWSKKLGAKKVLNYMTVEKKIEDHY